MSFVSWAEGIRSLVLSAQPATLQELDEILGAWRASMTEASTPEPAPSSAALAAPLADASPPAAAGRSSPAAPAAPPSVSASVPHLPQGAGLGRPRSRDFASRPRSPPRPGLAAPAGSGGPSPASGPATAPTTDGGAGREAPPLPAGWGQAQRIYVVTRPRLHDQLGVHTTSWMELCRRLALWNNTLAGSGCHVKRVASLGEAEAYWQRVGLSGTPPLHGPT